MYVVKMENCLIDSSGREMASRAICVCTGFLTSKSHESTRARELEGSRKMFTPKDGSSRLVLLRGPPELTKPFVFEAAIDRAEKGHRVIYVTPRPLQSLPAIYHDRKQLSPGAFKLVRFMYLENYESLVDQLVDLHNFEVVPSVLLIDDLDAYTEDSPCRRAKRARSEIRTVAATVAARLLALLRDSINACSRILNSPVDLLCASSSLEIGGGAYFREVWQLSHGSLSPRVSRLDNANEETTAKIFDYRYLTDGSLALRQISARLYIPRQKHS